MKYNGRRNCRLEKKMNEETRQKLSASRKKNSVKVQRDEKGQFLKKNMQIDTQIALA